MKLNIMGREYDVVIEEVIPPHITPLQPPFPLPEKAVLLQNGCVNISDNPYRASSFKAKQPKASITNMKAFKIKKTPYKQHITISYFSVE